MVMPVKTIMMDNHSLCLRHSLQAKPMQMSVMMTRDHGDIWK